jgi:hypothetical protein
VQINIYSICEIKHLQVVNFMSESKRTHTHNCYKVSTLKYAKVKRSIVMGGSAKSSKYGRAITQCRDESVAEFKIRQVTRNDLLAGRVTSSK